MLPKNSKHYIAPTAEQLEIDSQLVEDVISFYYSTVRRSLSNLEHHNVMVENLGTFQAKPGDLPQLIAKHMKHLSVLTKDTFSQMAIRKDINAKLEKVLALQKSIAQEKSRKKEFFKKKKNGNSV